MPDGKPAGVRCIHLTADFRCALFGKPERPAVCNSLRASVEMCGSSAREVYEYLARLERSTTPGSTTIAVSHFVETEGVSDQRR